MKTLFWERERFSVLSTAGHGFGQLADVAVCLSDTSVVDGSSSGLCRSVELTLQFAHVLEVGE